MVLRTRFEFYQTFPRAVLVAGAPIGVTEIPQ